MRNIIFSIDGGLGKNIMATAVCSHLKRKYPDDKLIVLTAYPDVFINNDDVHRSLNANALSYFYKDYIEDKDSLLFLHNPYKETDYVYEKKHLIQTWCEMFGLEYDKDIPLKLSLTTRERDMYQKKYQSDKPIMLIQPNGGFNAEIKYAWSRDLPYRTVCSIVEEFRSTYNIIHIKRDDQMSYEHTFPITHGFRDVLSLMMLSEKRLFIDSFCQHAASALGLSSTTCWIGTSPKVFGYDLHDNIKANPETKKAELKGAVFNRFNIGGDPLEFPYNSEDDIFDVNAIIDSLKK